MWKLKKDKNEIKRPRAVMARVKSLPPARNLNWLQKLIMRWS